MVQSSNSENPSKEKSRKIIIVGAKSVGKSTFAIQFVDKRFESQYNPTIESTYKKDVLIRNIPYKLDIVDTAGLDEYSIFQQQHAIAIDAYIMVYSITDKRSFDLIENINEKILNQTGIENIPRIVVANKSDLENERRVTKQDGEELSKKLNCLFAECSAKTSKNVNFVVEELVSKIDNLNLVKSDNSKPCNIL